MGADDITSLDEGQPVEVKPGLTLLVKDGDLSFQPIVLLEWCLKIAYTWDVEDRSWCYGSDFGISVE